MDLKSIKFIDWGIKVPLEKASFAMYYNYIGKRLRMVPRARLELARKKNSEGF